METLPPEMVRKVARLLSPQDLARCCDVCRYWRDIFNENCHWRPHCDPSLEEHLRTTPCAVEPAFVAPEATNSTLTPISYWRLAWLREKHLWKNLKQGNHKIHVTKVKDAFQRFFLTNDLLVIWYSDGIEIWDVRVIPATLLAKTDSSVDLRNCSGSYCSIVGNCMLLVEQSARVIVFHVDDINKRIKLIHCIPLDETRPQTFNSPNFLNKVNIITGSIHVRVNTPRTGMEIIDIKTGNKLKNESCPLFGNGSNEAFILGIKGSPYSDNVVVLVQKRFWPSKGNYHCYIYSLGNLTFLPGPVVKLSRGDIHSFAIHGQYLAVCEGPTTQHTKALNIYNCHTLELLCTTHSSGLIVPHAINDGFVFIVFRDSKCWIEMYSLVNKKLITSFQSLRTYRTSLEVINDNIVSVCFGNEVELWEASGETLHRVTPAIRHGHKINQALTRGVYDDFPSAFQDLCIYYYW